MDKKGYIFMVIAMAVFTVLISIVVPHFTKKEPDNTEKQMQTYIITNLPGFAEFQPAAGYQVKALHKDPNDGYIPYLSTALSEVKNSWLRKNETIISVLPAKYDKSGDLQRIWVATKR